MSLSSYSDVFEISHERGYDEEIRVGDQIRTGPNHYPYYTVVAIDGDKAWVRNVLNGQDSLALLNRCRRIHQDDSTLAVAAE